MAKDYRLEKRKFVIGGIALTIVLIYLIRLFVLQITTDDYKKNADSNAFLNKIQYPSRGAIYDRNGWYSTSRPMTSLLSRKRSKIWIHSIYVSRWALLVLSSLRS